jgi:multidrug efflux pump subunit AcrA (membrane-fusion protein)
VSTSFESPLTERTLQQTALFPAIPAAGHLPKESTAWRTIRLCIAVPLLLFSFAELLPFAVLPVSTQAVVNARLSEVRSPMEGVLGPVSLETGDVVSVDEPLVSSSVPHTTLRNEAMGDSRSRGDMEQEVSRLGAELEAAQSEKARYDQMYTQYMKSMVSDLALQVSAAQTSYQSSQQRAASAADALKRAQQALKDHLAPKQMVDEASDKADKAQSNVEIQEANLQRLQEQLTNARAGVILNQTQTPTFLAARDGAMAQVDRLQDQKAALELEIAQPNAMDRLANAATSVKATIVSPVSGTIWSRAVATGQTVQQGDELFRIADANSIHVEVWLDRRYGPQLSIGDTALVYLSGMGKELTGRVTSFEGTSRRVMVEEVNAIDLQAVHPDQYHVSIELDPSERKTAYIGQSAKVLFPGSRHHLRASIYFWLARL